MKKSLIVLLLLFLSFFYGCSEKQEQTQENTLIYEKNGITYEIKNRSVYVPSMNWIKNNLPENAVISSWWDYGHMIRGVAEREVIVFNPSKEILYTTNSGKFSNDYNTKKLGDYSDNERIKDTAIILTSSNENEVLNLMKKYESNYILISQQEYGKSPIIHNISGISTDIVEKCSFRIGVKEIDSQNSQEITCNINKKSMIYKMLILNESENFEKIYSDNYIVIYKKK